MLQVWNTVSVINEIHLWHRASVCSQNGWQEVTEEKYIQDRDAQWEGNMKGTKPISRLSRTFLSLVDTVLLRIQKKKKSACDSVSQYSVYNNRIVFCILLNAWFAFKAWYGCLLISFRNFDNKRTESDVWWKQAVMQRYWALSLMWNALCCIFCTVNIAVTEQMLLPRFVILLAQRQEKKKTSYQQTLVQQRQLVIYRAEWISL